MESREINISEAGEHLLGIFRALLEVPKFRKFVDKNFVIQQYYDSADEKLLRVEIKDKVDSDDDDPGREALH